MLMQGGIHGIQIVGRPGWAGDYDDPNSRELPSFSRPTFGFDVGRRHFARRPLAPERRLGRPGTRPARGNSSRPRQGRARQEKRRSDYRAWQYATCFLALLTVSFHPKPGAFAPDLERGPRGSNSGAPAFSGRGDEPSTVRLLEHKAAKYRAATDSRIGAHINASWRSSP